MADDEYLVVEALKTIFTEIDNVEVIGEATSGKKILELFDSSYPDMMFLDINIPGVNVQDVIKYMKDSNHNTVVILLIDIISSNIANRALNIGVDGYIEKPINKKEIIELVNQYFPILDSEEDDFKQVIEEVIQNIHVKEEIQSALNYIEKNFQNGVTLEEVAEYVHLSPFYLSKLFKKELNIKFVSYVTERKMEKAKELLESTGMPVINIALELNYREPNYFSKVFKKHIGMTASEYRKIKGKSQGTLLQKHHPIQNGKWYI